MDNQRMETMEVQETENYAMPGSTHQQSPNHMATASMVMGILALVLCCCPYTVFLFGGLGILFACLSRTEETMRGQAKAGLILSILAFALIIILYTCLFVYSFELMALPDVLNMPITIPLPTETGIQDNILTIFPGILTGGGI